VARAMQSDSARVWDLAFAKPVRAVAVNELEQLIGLSTGARFLVTAAQDTVHIWDTATGNRVATLPVGAASAAATLTGDGTHLLVRRTSDSDTTFELWSLDNATIDATLDVAGSPALVSLDPGGNRIAIADYDRAIRVWSFREGTLLAQFDLTAQPSEIRLAAGGEVLGAVFGSDGAAMWRIDNATDPLLEEVGSGRWQLAFSPSGSRALIGRSERGFQTYDTTDGRALGPPLGSAARPGTARLLAFSTDEQIIVTSGENSIARFWRAPTLPTRSESGIESAARSIWPPSGDAVAVATPDASKIVIGDDQGNVHVLPADADREELLSRAQGISFFGHNAAVRHLEVSPDGLLVASAANDNSVRVWNLTDGLPRQFIGEVHGATIDRLVFSPSATRLGILNGRGAEIIDVSTGEILVRFDLGEYHQGIAFADDDHLYLGGESGALRVIARESGDSWNMQTLWQGNVAIRSLEASPKSRFLVLVDRNNLAQLFDLAEGRIGEMTLQLPNPAEEVTFALSGYRVLFRTSNWIHRASSSGAGLVWIDAILTPKAVNSARMVFGDPAIDEAAALGNRLFLPVAADAQVRLAELSFTSSRGAGLFGSKDQLLSEWRQKLALVAAQGSDE
ncbi:MAG: WD40 repeat domain-containing protein, partial [Gammaproteobacteria bacterium]|nr:WD40 repeat domain-containing protein [Gammaproteobacteria bacterium]